MNEFVCIGKIVNTHGIKGELKILSDFPYIKKALESGRNVYIGLDKIKEVVESMRIHKCFYLVLLKGYANINEVLKYKGLPIYVKREEVIPKDSYILDDLIGCMVYDKEKVLGKVIDYYENHGNPLLEVKGEKCFYIPMQGNYIKKVNVEEKKIETEKGSELIL